MENKNISKGIKILIASFIPILFGPFSIHLGQLKNNYILIILGVGLCFIAIVMIFMSLFGIINELFKKWFIILAFKFKDD